MALATIAFREEDEAFTVLDYAHPADDEPGFTGLNLTYFDANGAEHQYTSQAAAPPRRAPPKDWEADFLGQDVARFFYRWGGTFSSVLARLRGRYDGDLDQFLIHLVFMLTELACVNAAAEAKAKGAQTVIVRRRGLNVLSLADITRIPRESVRRKLAALLERGLVERGEDGLYRLGPASDLDRFFYELAPLFWDKAGPAA